MSKPPAGLISGTYANGKFGNQGTPGTEETVNLLSAPINRHERRSKKKQLSKYLDKHKER